MRRVIAALAALFFLPGAALAAFAVFQTYAGPPQIFYNIVTDGGAVCQDNHVVVTRVTSINSGSAVLNVSVDTFTAGDVGKFIAVPGASGGAGTLRTTIQTFNSTQQVVLALAAGTTLASVSTAITYGNDDAPNFKTFNTWARANQGTSNQVVLTIPNGSNCWFGSAQTISGTTVTNVWAAGVKNLIVDGAGATINSIDGSGFQLGGQGVKQIGLASVGGASARIQTATAGATQLTLTAASYSAGYISRFVVGTRVMLGGLDIQNLWNGPYGFPQNNQYFEWRIVTAVCNNTGACPGAAVITIDQPLTNTYLDTWPNYNSGNDFEVDSGGPATVYALNDTWDMTVEYRGLTITQDGQTYAAARNVTYRDVIFTGAHGGIPTQNETWSAYNVDFGFENMEFDKLIGTVIMDNVTIAQIKIQSSSVNNLIMANSTVTSNLTGNPKSMSITDSTLASLSLGAYAYGVSPGTVTCTRCDITSLAWPGGIAQGRASDYSMSSGVISFLNTSVSGPDPTSRVFVPDSNIFFSASGWLTSGVFRVLGVTQDATNVYVQTNQVGGFPTGVTFSGFRTGPVVAFTCDACTGDENAVAMNIQNGATPGAPFGIYSYKTFAPTANFKNTRFMPAMGRFVRLKVNVTQPYTGTGSAIVNPTGEFMMPTLKADGTTFDFWPTINLKQAGERVITVGGVTCNGAAGACSGDTITAPPEAVWIPNGLDPSQPSTLSGGGVKPQYTITIETERAP